MSDDPSWEEVARGWARSEYLLRGKAHKHTVQVVATVPGDDGEDQNINLMPTGDPCDYVTWRVRIEMLGHGEMERSDHELAEALALLRQCEGYVGCHNYDDGLFRKVVDFLERHGGQG